MPTMLMPLLLVAALAAGNDDAHRHAVDHRHDQATGVPHQGTTHHFLLSPEGGSIRLEADDASQTEVRDRIRLHLQAVTRTFAVGDFSMPLAIHAQMPPGADVMSARKEAIRYSYAPSERGGTVAIVTHDPEALTAIHEFLRFQIRDHATGDPTE